MSDSATDGNQEIANLTTGSADTVDDILEEVSEAIGSTEIKQTDSAAFPLADSDAEDQEIDGVQKEVEDPICIGHTGASKI